jgi:hypothetical protein
LGKEDVLRLLALDERTNLEMTSGQNNRTLAHFIVLKIVEYMRSGDAQEADFWSKLFLEILEKRQDYHYTLDQPDARNCTPLYVAVKNGLDPKLCVTLRQRGASITRGNDLNNVTVESLLQSDTAIDIKAAFAAANILDPDACHSMAPDWLLRVDLAIRQNNKAVSMRKGRSWR